MNSVKDQTQQTEEDTTAAVETEDTSTPKAAIKTSEAFDKLADANPEDVEDTPSEDKDDEKKDSKESEDKDDSKADDKDTGDEEDKDSEKSDGKGHTKINDELNQKALDLGYNEEELKDFDSAEALEKLISDTEEAIAADEPAKKSDSTQSDDKKKAEDTKSDTSLKFENEDDIDPEILKGMKDMKRENKELRERVDKLSSNIDQNEQVRLQESRNQFGKRMDGMVDKLGLDFAPIFGKGPIAKLDHTSNAFKARDAVRAHMLAFATGFAEVGDDMPTEQKLFDMAVRSLHEKTVETSEGLQSGKKNQAYKKGAHLSRSATKKAGKLTGDQKAIKTSQEFDQLIDTSED